MLIQTLNKLGHLTPDEIVKNLNNLGWVHVFTIDRDTQQALFQTECVFYSLEWGPEEPEIYGEDDEPWTFWMSWDEIEEFRYEYRQVWVIPRGQFHGTYPDPQ